jgi:hypothetical protein
MDIEGIEERKAWKATRGEESRPKSLGTSHSKRELALAPNTMVAI